jgi:hypothetical protein
MNPISLFLEPAWTFEDEAQEDQAESDQGEEQQEEPD